MVSEGADEKEGRTGRNRARKLMSTRVDKKDKM